jgi:hypothetical protein
MRSRLITSQGLQVEVADRSLVLRARGLAWSRELALTTLAARRTCPRLGECFFPRTPAPAASLIVEAVMTPRK